jgi:hypothetical protein
MPAEYLEIWQPKLDQKMPQTFTAAGSARGNVRWVEGKLYQGTTTTLVSIGTLVFFGQRPHSDGNGAKPRFRWVIVFKEIPAIPVGEYTFKVQGYTSKVNGQPVGGEYTVKFKVAAALERQGPFESVAPTYAFPPPNYTIESDERDRFLPFGASEIPITAASIGSHPADHTDWDQHTNVWWAEFSGLASDPGPGMRYLVVSNADGDVVQNVTIADS